MIASDITASKKTVPFDLEEDTMKTGRSSQPTNTSRLCLAISAIIFVFAAFVALGSLLIRAGKKNALEECPEPPCQATIDAGIWILVTVFAVGVVLIGTLLMLRIASNRGRRSENV